MLSVIINDKVSVILQKLAGQDDPEYKTKELRRSLWRAPEHLRDTNPPARGTQKGDVYSFGIVLYEIVGRNGPWGKLNMSESGETCVHVVVFHPECRACHYFVVSLNQCE